MAAVLAFGAGLVCALFQITDIVLVALNLGICVVIHENHPFRSLLWTEKKGLCKRKRGISWYYPQRLKTE